MTFLKEEIRLKAAITPRSNMRHLVALRYTKWLIVEWDDKFEFRSVRLTQTCGIEHHTILNTIL